MSNKIRRFKLTGNPYEDTEFSEMAANWLNSLDSLVVDVEDDKIIADTFINVPSTLGKGLSFEVNLMFTIGKHCRELTPTIVNHQTYLLTKLAVAEYKIKCMARNMRRKL